MKRFLIDTDPGPQAQFRAVLFDGTDAVVRGGLCHAGNVDGNTLGRVGVVGPVEAT